MRCSFDGLQALVRQGLGGDPLDGGLYVLINRRGNQIRVLYFDRGGLCLWAKRLEAGRSVSDWPTVHSRTLDWNGLKLLFEGIEPARQRKRFKLTSAQDNTADKPCAEINCSDVTTRGDTLIDDAS